MKTERIMQSTTTGSVALLTDEHHKPIEFKLPFVYNVNRLVVHYYTGEDQLPNNRSVVVMDHIGFPSDEHGTFWYEATPDLPIVVSFPSVPQDTTVVTGVVVTDVYVPAALNRHHTFNSNSRLTQFLKYNDLLNAKVFLRGHGIGTIVRIATVSETAVRAITQFADGETMPLDYTTVINHLVED